MLINPLDLSNALALLLEQLVYQNEIEREDFSYIFHFHIPCIFLHFLIFETILNQIVINSTSLIFAIFNYASRWS